MDVLLAASGCQAASTAFQWKDLIPLGAAIAALISVTATLVFTWLRDRRKFEKERRDAYQDRVREVVAKSIVASQEFQHSLRRVTRAADSGVAGRSKLADLADAVDDKSLGVLTALTTARMTVHDPALFAELDALFGAWSKCNAILYQRSPFDPSNEHSDAAREELTDAARDLGTRTSVLQSVGLDRLRPTVVQDSRLDS